MTMKTLIITVMLVITSFSVIADQCDDLAQKASQGTSSMSEALDRKYATQSYNQLCNGGQVQQPQQDVQLITTEPQLVPSMNAWCQTVNSVTNCWR
jgi:hypothetical protein